MNLDMTQILTTVITVCIPALVTILKTGKLRKQANKHSARQSILQLIMEDHIRVHEGGLPENYQNILHEYDEYIKSGGNSYIHDKVDEYKKWYSELNKKK